MSWYFAKNIFQVSADQSAARFQFEERLRLIEADNFDEAFLKARILGLAEEADFLNGHAGKSEFVNVSEIVPLRDLKDGQELSSQLHETDQATTYIHHIHQKAVAMQLKHRPIF